MMSKHPNRLDRLLFLPRMKPLQFGILHHNSLLPRFRHVEA